MKKENLIFINVEKTLQTWDTILMNGSHVHDVVLHSPSVYVLDKICEVTEASLVIISSFKDKSFNYYVELLRNHGLREEVDVRDCIYISEEGSLHNAVETYLEFKRDNIMNYVILDSGVHLQNLEYRRVIVNRHYGLSMYDVSKVLHLFAKPYLFDKDNVREVNVIKSLFVYANPLIEKPTGSIVQDMFSVMLKLDDDIVSDRGKSSHKELLVGCLVDMGIQNNYDTWGYEDVLQYFKSLVESLGLVKVDDEFPLLKVTTPKNFCDELNIHDSMSLLDEYTIDVGLFTVVHK